MKMTKYGDDSLGVPQVTIILLEISQVGHALRWLRGSVKWSHGRRKIKPDRKARDIYHPSICHTFEVKLIFLF